MGLRERNAAQTRELILDTALTLFVEQGYDATRMEEIAERADIGASTLYRYFPTKDQLVTEPLALRGQMATELRARPPEELLDRALGHAITALLTTPRPDTDRIRLLWAVLETAPGPQARLREEGEQERALLEQAIADRTGRDGIDAFCMMTARQTMSVLDLLGAQGTETTADDNRTAVRDGLEFLRGMLAELRLEPPVMPSLDD